MLIIKVVRYQIHYKALYIRLQIFLKNYLNSNVSRIDNSILDHFRLHQLRLKGKNIQRDQFACQMAISVVQANGIVSTHFGVLHLMRAGRIVDHTNQAYALWVDDFKADTVASNHLEG